MLRIKKDVDLKELEKYGFELVKQSGTYYGFELSDFYKLEIKDEDLDEIEDKITFNAHRRKLFVDCLFKEVSDKTLDILYDLIKSDLIEKVE